MINSLFLIVLALAHQTVTHLHPNSSFADQNLVRFIL
ncbi:hypothetical protein GLYMA_07G101501v4 [Glycine max]|nr:hypothetical protein GLYMA_07G101501v4 [Glycine max]KAH1086207.1 hypothetical protein GYH30_017947 [Glycine max]